MDFLKRKKLTNSSFTLIELLVVISVIMLLISVALVNFTDARRKGRDAKRFNDVIEIAKALNLHMSDRGGALPVRTCPCDVGSWETSDASSNPGSDWMEYLRSYFSSTPYDPINKRITGFSYFGPRPGNYYYAYYRYPSAAYCPEIKNPFAIIAIKDLEAYVDQNLPEAGMPLPDSVLLPRAKCGNPGPDGICTVAEYYAGQCRDWSQEYDYSIMIQE